MLKRSPVVWVVLVFALLGVVGLYWVAVWLADMNDADHGTIPDWIAAVATLAAFGAAVVAAWYAHRALTVEQERDRHRDEQSQRAQAELVAAWTQRVWWGSKGETKTPRRNSFSEHRLFVRNASELPVLNVRAVVSGRVFGPGSSQAVYRLTQVDIEIIPPMHEAEEHNLPPDTRDDVTRLQRDLGPDQRLSVTVGIIFTDAAGRHWIRDDDGSLNPAPPELVQRRAAERPL